MPVSFALPRARFFWWTFLLFLFAWGCAAPGPTGREWVQPVYREKINEWQMRIQREGWSESQIHSILRQFRALAAYRMEIVDHWDTPKEFMRKGFSGDCEDITVFMMGTLKQLGYPHRVRVLIVAGLFEDHALLRLEMPEGGWKVYDVVPPNVPAPASYLLRPLVEFDETGVNWFPSQAEASRTSKKANGVTASDPGKPGSRRRGSIGLRPHHCLFTHS